MITLYHMWDSPCCFKVRTVLAECGLDWAEEYIMTPKFDHFQPSYLALNPRNRIPTLVDDGFVVTQSSNISMYLAEKYVGPGLIAGTVEDRAVMRTWMEEEQESLFQLIVTLSFNIMMKLRAKGFGLDVLKKWSEAHPDQDRIADYLTRMTSPADLQAVAAAKLKMRWHLELLERQLSSHSKYWVCGEQYTLADVCLGPIMDRLTHLDMTELWSGLPAVSAWWQRVSDRAAFKAAAPPPEYRMWGPLKPVPKGGVDVSKSGNTFPAG